ncbi:hypothetical protein [Litoreibacter janthinus]|nr:hypothetical protein [Litoreibacter janthinus]
MSETTTSELQTMTFVIEGDVNVQVTITELASGDLQFDLLVLDDTGSIGDLNGLFFDLADPSLLDGLVADGGDVSNQSYAEGDVYNLGGGVNVKGELTQDEGFDAGIRLGSSGMAKDDIQETSFTLSHESTDLMLEDFYGADFAVRLTSVGEEDGSRDGSLKLGGTAPDAPDEPVDDPFDPENQTDDPVDDPEDDPTDDVPPIEDDPFGNDPVDNDDPVTDVDPEQPNDPVDEPDTDVPPIEDDPFGNDPVDNGDPVTDFDPEQNFDLVEEPVGEEEPPVEDNQGDDSQGDEILMPDDPFGELAMDMPEEDFEDDQVEDEFDPYALG